MTTIEQHSGSTVARAIGLYSFAILMLSVMDVLIKWLSADYSTVQIVAFRSGFGLVPVLFMVARSGGLTALQTKRWSAHLLRGLIGLATALCFFYAFSVMPLADAYAIAFAAPLMITALSVPMLGEAVGLRRWLAVIVGFVGVVIMLRPGTAGIGEMFDIGAIAAIAGTLFFSLTLILIRKMSRTETNAAIIFHAGIVILAGSLALLPFGFVMPSWEDFLLLALVGLMGGMGGIAMTEALRYASVAILAPFDYTAMIWAVAFGYVLWADLPDVWTLTGSAIVVASGLYILHRETRHGLAGGPVPHAVAKPAISAPADTTTP